MGVQVTARQLHLFKSRRQRGTLPPAPSEYQLHCAVVDTVKRWIIPGWIFTRIASGEKRDPVTAARLKRMEVTAGFPDLAFFDPHGEVCFIEAATSLATGIAEIGSAAAANIAAARGARRRRSAPNRSLRAARQRDWKRSCRRSASAYQRCSRQSQPTTASAPRPAASDASEATRRYGTWLPLVRNQILF